MVERATPGLVCEGGTDMALLTMLGLPTAEGPGCMEKRNAIPSAFAVQPRPPRKPPKRIEKPMQPVLMGAPHVGFDGSPAEGHESNAGWAARGCEDVGSSRSAHV